MIVKSGKGPRDRIEVDRVMPRIVDVVVFVDCRTRDDAEVENRRQAK